MPDETPRHGLKYMVAGQDDAEVTQNENLNWVDGRLHLNVVDRRSTAPAGVEGSCYILTATGSGDWAGFPAGSVAQYIGGAWQSLWVDPDTGDPVVPPNGVRAWIEDEKVTAHWTGSVWEIVTGEAIFGAYRDTSDQAVGASASVQWNTQLKTSAGVFTHSTSTNPDRVTVIAAGNYEISADVSIEYVSGTGEQQFKVQITQNGTPLSGFDAYGSVYGAVQTRLTVSVRAPVGLSAGDIVRVLVTHVSGGGSLEIKADASRFEIRRV